MSGAVAGLIGSVKKAAAGAPTNIVLNGSATTTSTTNYYLGSRSTSAFKTTPASWLATFDGGTELLVVEYFAPALTVGTRYSVSVWVKNNSFAQDVTLSATFGSTVINLTQTPTTSAWMNYKIENALCATNSSLDIFVYATDANFYVDDITCVEGATALT
jgi:hypothetical protein